MVALESVFLTSAIDAMAMEDHKVVMITNPGAFLHAHNDNDNEDYVLMKKVGTLAELMVKKMNPKLYRK